MKKYGIIYLITNLVTNKKYIGQTIKTLKERVSQHVRDDRSGRHLHSSINKHGLDNFIFEEVLTCFDKDSLNFTFYYADQSGSLEVKNSEHAQRIDLETAKAE